MTATVDDGSVGESRFYDLSEKDTWRTPDWILDAIEVHHAPIDTDPAAGEYTAIGNKYNWTREDNGLDQPWDGVVFANPPFSFKMEFLEKAVEEYENGNVDVIFFVTPDGTDRISWWHTYCVQADYTWFAEGRVDYLLPDGSEPENSAPFGTAIHVFGEPTDEMKEWFAENGDLLERVDA